MLVLSRSRSVTPAEGAFERSDYPSYNYLNSGRPPKILESPLDSKSLLSGKIRAVIGQLILQLLILRTVIGQLILHLVSMGTPFLFDRLFKVMM